MENYAGLEGFLSDYDSAEYVVVPIPYEKTTTYGKGTVDGPNAVIDASTHMELFDIETESTPFEKGIATLDPIELASGPQDIVEPICGAVKNVFKDRKFPIVVGGEHSISIGCCKAATECFEDVSILHFDAHMDLRDELGGSMYSHGCVMSRVREFNNNVFSLGIRSMCDEEFLKTGKLKKSQLIYSWEVDNPKRINEMISELGQHTYITFDVDVFDPSIMSATGTPEPGGLSWRQVLDMLRKVFTQTDVIGCDVVELSPNSIKACDFMVSKLIYKIISYRNEQKMRYINKKDNNTEEKI